MKQSDQEYWTTRDVARILSLVEAERRYFQEIVGKLPLGVAVFSRQLEFVMVNRSFRRLFQMGERPLAECDLDKTVPVAELRQPLEAILQGRETSQEILAEVKIGEQKKLLQMTIAGHRDWHEEAVQEVILVAADLSTAVAGQTLQSASNVEELQWRLDYVNGVIWEADPASLLFTWTGGKPATQWRLSGSAWSAGADLTAARVLATDRSKVRQFYERIVAGEALESCDYRAAALEPETVWLRDLVQVERNEQGSPLRIHGLTLNITGVRGRERSTAQAERVKAVSNLAGRVSHDCNNLVMILSGYSEDLMHALPPEHVLRSHIQEILHAGDRLSALTQRINSYLEYQAPEVQPFGIDAALEEVLPELLKLGSQQVSISLSLRATDTTCRGDRKFVQETVRILVRRAVEAMPGGGAITIESRASTVGDATTSARPSLEPGPYVRVSVRDNGYAIPPEALQSLFEPSPGSEPTPHHLGTHYRAIREGGGDLMGESEFGRGSAFTILLPVAAEASRGTELARQITVLVADDEDGIRALIRKILERQSYQVIEARNGRDALDLARQHRGPIDLLITDVMMPEVGGFELAQAICAIRPETRVLLISGYTGTAGFDPTQLPAGSGFLQKPFSLQALENKVREVLGGRATSTGA